jgi:hypothetical protein
MRTVTTALILGAGVVNLLPAIGAFSAERLQSLYGVVIDDPNLGILMRHRAVLFAIVGACSLLRHSARSFARGIRGGFRQHGSFVALALWSATPIRRSEDRVGRCHRVAGLGGRRDPRTARPFVGLLK